MNDLKLTDCQAAGCDGQVKRLLGTGGGILFKGAGFYQTDYRSSAYHSASKADGSSATSAAPTTTPAATPAAAPSTTATK